MLRLFTASVNWDTIESLTLPSIQAYADKIGASLTVFRERMPGTHIHYTKWKLASLPWDRAIWLDLDVIVNPTCPNLFDIVPKDSIGVFNEYAVWQKKRMKLRNYYNCGVMVLSDQHRSIMRPPYVSFGDLPEQDLFNIRASDYTIYELDPTFNALKWDGEIKHFAHLNKIETINTYLDAKVTRTRLA